MTQILVEHSRTFVRLLDAEDLFESKLQELEDRIEEEGEYSEEVENLLYMLDKAATDCFVYFEVNYQKINEENLYEMIRAACRIDDTLNYPDGRERPLMEEPELCKKIRDAIQAFQTAMRL